jgi:hypothetical protein
MTRTLVLALTSLLLAETASAAVGKVLLASGSVTVERKDERAVQAGDALEAGDVVTTGEQSGAQLLMADGGRVVLRANSRLRIDELTLPSSVQAPNTPVAAASFGKSVVTLLKGGLTMRPGVIGKSNPSGTEMRTPMGTVGVRDARYSAVICDVGECGHEREGLYLTVDDGTLTFDAHGSSHTLTAPAVEFIPVDAGVPQELAAVPELVEQRASPSAAPLERFDAFAPAAISLVPERPILATTVLGRTVDLVVPETSALPRASVAVAVPSSGQSSFTTATTGVVSADTYNSAGRLLQFQAPDATGASAETYRIGTAALLGSGSNGASGIAWGRWSEGAASAGRDTMTLANASLHWIVGPTFELAPTLPTSGTTHFVIAGGTDPTDANGHIGRLGRAVLTVNFTTQQVTTSLSLDIDGLNWLASGSGPIAAGTVRFGGTFDNVLIDGRVHGSGDFDGFFSAGPMTPDQLNGAGLAYQLRDSLGDLGTVSGVAAFVPGTGATPVAPTVWRDVAYSIGSVGTHLQAGGSASDRLTQLATDTNGNLTALSAPLAGTKGTTFRLNMGTIADAGFDAATGIRWGRWEGDNIYVTPPASTTTKSDLTDQSLHWLAGSSYGAAPVLPRSGTADFTLVGNTNPTDTSGNVGTLGKAGFFADFTNRSVNSALALTMAGHTWYARGYGTFAANGTLFSGTYDTVSIDNLVAGSGNFSGFFTVPRVGAGSVAGAGLTFNVVGDPADLGTVSGALAFQEGLGTLVTPPPLAARDIAYIAPITGLDDPQVIRTNGYAVDETFSLVQMGSLDIGTSTLAESAASGVVMMRWGRWADGSLIKTDVVSGATSAVALGQSSLHWLESADTAPPVVPTNGTASYQLIGATTPTDRLGNLGTLNSATFNADFTAQQVSASVDITINGESWIANGMGSIGAPAGLQPHQFGGAFSSGAVGASGATPSGSFRGFFTNPGAGFTYTVSNPTVGTSVDGAAVFRKP